MPSRSTINRFDTPVQGDDAWVEIEAIKYGELKELTRKAREALKGDSDEQVDSQLQLTETLIVKKVKRWNWVDDDGQPLPFPSADPTVVDQLTSEELAVLSKLIMNTDEIKKKAKT